MDLKFEVNGNKFNVRSSCIIKNKTHDQVLLTNMRAIKSHDAFLLPGGRLEFMENSMQAIDREIQEELGLKLDFKLISIEENFDKENNFQMIEFVFYAEIESFDLIKNMDNGWDKFIIINICDIDNYDIRPKSVKNLIKLEEYEKIEHNNNYDWGK